MFEHGGRQRRTPEHGYTKNIAANKPLYLFFVDLEKAEESSLVGLKRVLG